MSYEMRDPSTGAWLGPDLDVSWILQLIVGLITLGLGIAILVWPKQTVGVVVILSGIFLLIWGIFRFVFALAERELDHRWMIALGGVLGVLVGLIVIRNPRESLELLIVLLGLLWVFAGAVELFQAIVGRDDRARGTRAVFGAFWVILGLVLLFWPEATVLVVAILVGINFIVSGLIQIVLAFQLRKATA